MIDPSKRRKPPKAKIATLPQRASTQPAGEPLVPKPVTVRLVAGFRPRAADFLRYLLGWELQMDTHVTFPRGDVNEPAQLRDVRLQTFAPMWWEILRGLWPTKT